MTDLNAETAWTRNGEAVGRELALVVFAFHIAVIFIWIDPNPIAGREMKNRHRFVVITPKEINVLGIAMTVPISSGAGICQKLWFNCGGFGA